MATKRAWNIRFFQPGVDDAAVVKLLGQVATFDGGVSALSATMLAARLAHPSAQAGGAWRVAESTTGTIIGIIAGCVVAVALVVGAIVHRRRRNARSSARRK